MQIPSHDRSHPLSGCWAKIHRAKETIDQLDRLIVAFIASDPYIPVGRKNLDTTTRDVRHTLLVAGDPVPLVFSVCAGEVVHHLRSTLDHLVWQLIERNGKGHTSFHEFPVVSSSKRFRRAGVQRKIDGLSPSAAALIESLQPYKTNPVSPNDSPLCIVHTLDIIDKHHGLNVVVGRVRTSQITVRGDLGQSGGVFAILSETEVSPTKQGAVVARMTTCADQANVDIAAQFDLEVAFDKFGTSQNQPVIPSLQLLTDAAIDTLNRFSGECP